MALNYSAYEPLSRSSGHRRQRLLFCYLIEFTQLPGAGMHILDVLYWLLDPPDLDGYTPWQPLLAYRK
jgi:hypothetical protein